MGPNNGVGGWVMGKAAMGLKANIDTARWSVQYIKPDPTFHFNIKPDPMHLSFISIPPEPEKKDKDRRKGKDRRFCLVDRICSIPCRASLGRFWIKGWIAPGWFERNGWIHPILQNKMNMLEKNKIGGIIFILKLLSNKLANRGLCIWIKENL